MSFHSQSVPKDYQIVQTNKSQILQNESADLCEQGDAGERQIIHLPSLPSENVYKRNTASVVISFELNDEIDENSNDEYVNLAAK